MIIYFDEDRLPDEWTAETMSSAAELCMRHEGIDPENVSLSVSFVGREEIRELNRDYRGVDSVTDVLSFPQFEEEDLPWADISEEDLEEGEGPGEGHDCVDGPGEDAELPDGEEIALGDVVICADKAREQAEEFGHSYERELIYLFVHSVFHLLGYDHMEEAGKKEMRAAEESVMDGLGIPRA